jgi:hypothetical protein
MRTIAEAFVVAPPAGVRVRTRLMLSAQDAQALVALGTHLGSLAGRDLARRCGEGRLDVLLTDVVDKNVHGVLATEF